MKEYEIKLTHNPARGAHVLKTRALIFSNDQEYWFKFIADTSETFTGTITIVAKKSGASYDLTSDMRWRVPDELLGYVGMVTAEVTAVNPGKATVYMSTQAGTTYEIIKMLDAYVRGFVPIYGVNITVTAT